VDREKIRKQKTKGKRKMKTVLLKLTILAAVLGLVSPGIHAEQKHKQKIIAGPKGGLMLETTPAAEFFVEKDHSVSLTFYDKAMKAIPVQDQAAMLTVDAKSGKKKIEMEKKGGALASKSPLPKSDGYNVVVQIKATPDAKPKNFRILLDMSICGGCQLAEYACTCDE
jgi:hypothetical protein